MRLAIAALDRLVELVELRGGRLPAVEAARGLLALAELPDPVARSLLEPLVEQDARLAWQGPFLALAERPSPLLEDATFVVFDLETTGLAAGSSQISEIGAVRVERLELAGSFETLVELGALAPRFWGGAFGPAEASAPAPEIETAIERFRAFAEGGLLAAHNARFDVAFVDHELGRLFGQRLSAPVLDTLPLARGLLRGRAPRVNLASLSFFFGVSVEPCHRALPDALATAEVLLCLIELAKERGAATVADLEALAAAAPRRASKRTRAEC